MVAFAHGGNQSLDQGQGCPVVELESAAGLVVIADHPLEADRRSAGVVDQNVNVAETLDRLGGDFGCSAALREVGNQDGRPLMA